MKSFPTLSVTKIKVHASPPSVAGVTSGIRNVQRAVSHYVWCHCMAFDKAAIGSGVLVRAKPPKTLRGGQHYFWHHNMDVDKATVGSGVSVRVQTI